MLTRTLLAGTAALLIATPAFANHCPADAAAIDHALEAMSPGEEVRTQVQALRDEGMEQHEAGDHAAAEDTLAEAMRTLLMAAE